MSVIYIFQNEFNVCHAYWLVLVITTDYCQCLALFSGLTQSKYKAIEKEKVTGFFNIPIH